MYIIYIQTYLNIEYIKKQKQKSNKKDFSKVFHTKTCVKPWLLMTALIFPCIDSLDLLLQFIIRIFDGKKILQIDKIPKVLDVQAFYFHLKVLMRKNNAISSGIIVNMLLFTNVVQGLSDRITKEYLGLPQKSKKESFAATVNV